MSSGMPFQFYIFGPPKLRIGLEPVDLPPQPAALCSFLVLNRQRRVTREEVQAVFWPDAAPPRAQERLRRTLYLLRRAIDPHTYLVTTEGAEMAIAPEADLWVDYEAFEKALMDAYRHDPPSRNPLEKAAAFYTDDLLKDIYADWVLLEREHARQRFLTALRDLVRVCQAEGDGQAVIRYAHLLLERDPFQEAAHRALMTAYAAAGDRSAALRQYQQCAQLLRDEMGAEPLPETTRLYEDIRQGRGVTVIEAAAPTVMPAPSGPDLQSLPLVGRDRELAEIAAEWRICRGGNSRLVLVTGSAGMGKTRLMEEAATRLPGPGVTVITGNCYAMEAGTPYQFISDLMRKAVDLVLDRLNPAVRADLAPLIPVKWSESRTGGSADRSGPVPDASVRLQEAVTQVIRLLASERNGLWLVAEDLHWADPASLACLNHALRRCGDLPLLVLATLRDEEVPFDSPLMDWPTSSVHAPAPTTLVQLRPLPREELHALLEQLVQEDTAQLASLLHIETAGNPFFVVETLRALIEQGVLYTEPGGSWRLRVGALSQPHELPMSEVVLRVIRGRIRRLSRAAQEVLTAAAVVEHDIDERLLAALVDSSLSLDLALDEILRAFILDEPSPGLYQFAHIKVREIIYADTSAPRRRFLHRRTAEILAQQGKHERLADISRLAYHYAQAREWTPALVNGWRAAQTAWNAGAMAEANRYAEVAQAILDEHLGDLAVDSLPEQLPAIRFDLLSLRAEFRRRATTAGLYYPPDLIEAIEALLPEIDDLRQARASLQRAMHLLGKGDLTAAQETAERGRGLYARFEDRWGELDAIQRQIDIAYRAGDMVALRRLLDEMGDLSPLADYPDIRQSQTYNEMRLAVYAGEWLRVLDLAQELSSRQPHSDPAVAWLSLAELGLAYMKLGAYQEAYTVARRAVSTSEEAHVLGLGARVLLARLELYRGNLEQAQNIMLDVLETPDPLIGESEVVAPALVLVRCYVAAGDDKNAKRWARRAAQAVSRIRLPILYPLSQVAWALTHLAAGRYEDAQKRLRYPLEFMLLLEETSPQEIFALRAAAAQGLRDHETAQRWLAEARQTIEQQADQIADPAYRETFLNQPLHQFIAAALSHRRWKPQELFAMRDDTWL